MQLINRLQTIVDVCSKIICSVICVQLQLNKKKVCCSLSPYAVNVSIVVFSNPTKGPRTTGVPWLGVPFEEVNSFEVIVVVSVAVVPKKWSSCGSP